uniref:Uncharacterized protein n=1 Tax=viral metagenome TaxID=1070528 RepID=A0A6C0I277_9ZZZZ
MESLINAAENNNIGISKKFLQHTPNGEYITITIRGPVNKDGQHHGICIIYSGVVSTIMYFNNGSACFDKPVLIKRVGEMYKGYINTNFQYHGSGLLTFLGMAKHKTPDSIFSINGSFINGGIDCEKKVEVHYLNGDVVYYYK